MLQMVVRRFGYFPAKVSIVVIARQDHDGLLHLAEPKILFGVERTDGAEKWIVISMDEIIVCPFDSVETRVLGSFHWITSKTAISVGRFLFSLNRRS